MNHSLRFLALVVFATAASLPGRAAESSPNSPHNTYVIVHGATGGGWDWKIIDRLLTADGQVVYRPTLTGLGEKVHLASPDINLTTHINDIVNVILFEDLHDVVLVGHSYGGMVITGVMDRIPERLSHVIFLDAAAPDDGQSLLDFRGPLDPAHKVVDGMIQFAWLDPKRPIPHDVPQPLKTFTEPVSYKNPAAKRLPVTFAVFASGANPEDNPGWQHAKARGWTIRILATDHNAQRSHPQLLLELLEDALRDRNQP